jgi:TonB family protein
MSKLIFSCILLSLFVAHGAAQSPNNRSPRTISGGVVNGKALTLPKPTYPLEALQKRVQGKIKVKVTIDEHGIVTSATAFDGVDEPSLRHAAEMAAMSATFSPTTLEGEPARVSGTIDYNFVLPDEGGPEQLKFAAFAMLLTVAGHFADEPPLFRKAFGDEDLIAELSSELPEFSNELKNVAQWSSEPVEKRKPILAAAVSTVRGKVGDSERWQIDLGKALGDLMGPIMRQAEFGDREGFIKLIQEADIKGYLTEIKKLSANAPVDLPDDIRAILVTFGSFADRNDLNSVPTVVELMESFGELIETISPSESTSDS